MSIEQYDITVINDRKELQNLSIKELYSLLPFTKEELKKLRYTKENIIEMVLNQFV